MRRGTTMAVIFGAALVGLATGVQATSHVPGAGGDLPPWGRLMPSNEAHITVDRGASRIRCWTSDKVRWWCWNADTALEGYLQIDPGDPRKLNLVHYSADGRFLCRYLADTSRSDGKNGWWGRFECPPRPGAAGASGRAAAEYNPNPLAPAVAATPPAERPREGGGGIVIRSGAIEVRIENFRLVAGPPGAALRCEWTTVYSNTGDEPVTIREVRLDQRVPGRPGAEFNRSYANRNLGLTVRPRQTITRPGDMGFTSSAASIRQIVDTGGMWWENFRYTAVTLPTGINPAGGYEVGVKTAFARLACPGGAR